MESNLAIEKVILLVLEDKLKALDKKDHSGYLKAEAVHRYLETLKTKTNDGKSLEHSTGS